MSDPFKSDNYNKNLDSLIQVIKLKDIKRIDKQYGKTLGDLSQALEGFTNKAEDIAKFIIYTDLNNYVGPVDKKPLGFFGVLKQMWLGKDASIEDDNIRNFVKGKLQNFTMEEAYEYTITLKGINILGLEKLNALKEILDSGQSEKEEHKPHEVNLESVIMSKQRKEEQPKKGSASNRMKKIKRPTMALPPPPTELKSEPQKKVTTTEKREVHFKSKPEVILFDDSGYGSLSDEESDKKISNYQEKELIYATVPKEHIEAKRANKQQQQSKPTIPPKPPVVPPISKKATDLGQKTKKDKPAIPPKPKNLGQQKLKKSDEDKPTIPLKKVADKAAPEVKVVAMKKEVNTKKDGRVKSMVGKFEQNQAAESKATLDAQADIGVKKDPAPLPRVASHSFPTESKKSSTDSIIAKPDLKPKVKDPVLTHVNIKQIAARFEVHGRK